MMEWRTAVAVILALSLALAACGGSDGEADSSAPSPAQPSSETSTGSPAAAEVSTTEEPAPAATEAETIPTAIPVPSTADNAPTEAASAPAESFDVAAHLSARTMELWDVYNTHDLDALKAFYAEAYWAEKAEEVESEMQPFRTFGISITGEEISAPMEVEPGKWEVWHDANFTLGSLTMLFIYEEFDGEWLLTYAEDQ